RWIHRDLPRTHNSSLGSRDYRSRSDIALIVAAKNKEPSPAATHVRRAGSDDAVMSRIHCSPDDEKQSRLRSLNHALRCYIAIRLPIKDQKAPAAAVADNNFVMLLVHGHGMWTHHQRGGTLNRADWRLCSCC